MPGVENQISFVNIQLDLLYFFTASLDEIKNEGGPVTPCFLFIINSTNYLATILQDWSEQAVSYATSMTIVLSWFSVNCFPQRSRRPTPRGGARGGDAKRECKT
jgi:hypothetical protein